MFVTFELAAGVGDGFVPRRGGFGNAVCRAQDGAPEREGALALDEVVEGEGRRRSSSLSACCGQKDSGGWTH